MVLPKILVLTQYRTWCLTGLSRNSRNSCIYTMPTAILYKGESGCISTRLPGHHFMTTVKTAAS